MQTQFRVPPSQPPRHAADKASPFTVAPSEQTGLLSDQNDVSHTNSILVAIVSATRLLRDALPLLLSDYLNIHVVAWYIGLPDDSTRFTFSDVVLLDSRLGHEVTLEWLTYWRSAVPPTPVLVMEMPNDPRAIVEYIRMGAGGYTIQDASAEEIATSIRHVVSGTMYCAPDVVAEMIARLQRMTQSPPEAVAALPLTPRELEVLQCLAGGMSNQEIGETLFIEICTVKHHVHKILEKLKLSRRWDAARLALNMGMTPQSPK